MQRGEINWCQTWLGNTQGVRFSQLALCIPRSSADIFTHSILEKYLGDAPKPHYNGVRVIMESQCITVHENLLVQIYEKFKHQFK